MLETESVGLDLKGTQRCLFELTAESPCRYWIIEEIPSDPVSALLVAKTFLPHFCSLGPRMRKLDYILLAVLGRKMQRM